MAMTKIQALWNHPAGLKTIHFWAPAFKWGVIVANLADIKKPPEDINYILQASLIASGAIWVRYSLVVIPKNWNLFSANAGMAATAVIQLARKYKHDSLTDQTDNVAAKQD